MLKILYSGINLFSKLLFKSVPYNTLDLFSGADSLDTGRSQLMSRVNTGHQGCFQRVHLQHVVSRIEQKKSKDEVQTFTVTYIFREMKFFAIPVIIFLLMNVLKIKIFLLYSFSLTLRNSNYHRHFL